MFLAFRFTGLAPVFPIAYIAGPTHFFFESVLGRDPTGLRPFLVVCILRDGTACGTRPTMRSYSRAGMSIRITSQSGVSSSGLVLLS